MPEVKSSSNQPNIDSDFSKNDKKDPNMAALFALLATFIIGLPSLVYLYVGDSRKALVYTLLLLGFSFALIICVFVIGVLTLGLGFLLFIPAILLIFAFDLAIVVDIYKLAKGEKALLPNF